MRETDKHKKQESICWQRRQVPHCFMLECPKLRLQATFLQQYGQSLSTTSRSCPVPCRIGLRLRQESAEANNVREEADTGAATKMNSAESPVVLEDKARFILLQLLKFESWTGRPACPHRPPRAAAWWRRLGEQVSSKMQYSRLLKIALICIPDEPIIFTLLCNFPCPPSCACAFTLGAQHRNSCFNSSILGETPVCAN